MFDSKLNIMVINFFLHQKIKPNQNKKQTNEQTKTSLVPFVRNMEVMKTGKLQPICYNQVSEGQHMLFLIR